MDAGNANAAVPDAEVLAFAAAEKRILLSHNRRTSYACISTMRRATQYRTADER